MKITKIDRFRLKLFKCRPNTWDFRLIDSKYGKLMTAPTTYPSQASAIKDAKQIVDSMIHEENLKPWRMFFSDGSSFLIGQFRRQRKFQQKRR